MIGLEKFKIRLEDKDDILRVHVMMKCFQEGHVLSMAEISVLIELHKLGYGDEFYNSCIEKKFLKSKQSVRNSIAKMGELGILSYKKRGERVINQDFIPDVSGEKVLFNYLVSNV